MPVPDNLARFYVQDASALPVRLWVMDGEMPCPEWPEADMVFVLHPPPLDIPVLAEVWQHGHTSVLVSPMQDSPGAAYGRDPLRELLALPPHLCGAALMYLHQQPAPVFFLACQPRRPWYMRWLPAVERDTFVVDGEHFVFRFEAYVPYEGSFEFDDAYRRLSLNACTFAQSTNHFLHVLETLSAMSPWWLFFTGVAETHCLPRWPVAVYAYGLLSCAHGIWLIFGRTRPASAPDPTPAADVAVQRLQGLYLVLVRLCLGAVLCVFAVLPRIQPTPSLASSHPLPTTRLSRRHAHRALSPQPAARASALNRRPRPSGRRRSGCRGSAPRSFTASARAFSACCWPCCWPRASCTAFSCARPTTFGSPAASGT